MMMDNGNRKQPARRKAQGVARRLRRRFVAFCSQPACDNLSIQP